MPKTEKQYNVSLAMAATCIADYEYDTARRGFFLITALSTFTFGIRRMGAVRNGQPTIYSMTTAIANHGEMVAMGINPPIYPFSHVVILSVYIYCINKALSSILKPGGQTTTSVCHGGLYYTAKQSLVAEECATCKPISRIVGMVW